MHEWLERHYSALTKIADVCLKKALCRRLLTLHNENGGISRENIAQDIVQDLALLLLENPRLTTELQERAGPDAGPDHIWKSAVITAYLSQLTDKARRDPDGFHYFRKNTVEALDERLGFRKQKHPGTGHVESWSLPPHGEELIRLIQDDWRDFQPPPDLPAPLTTKDASKKNVKQALLRSFYEQALAAAGARSGRVRLRDFMDWAASIGLFLPNFVENDAGRDKYEIMGADFQGLVVLDKTELCRAAQDLMAALDEKAQQALHYLFCREFTLKDSARRMGLAGPSSASAQFDRAKRQLKERIRAWPGTAFDSPSRSLQTHLAEKICEKLAARLKKSAPGSNIIISEP